jgi:precorrin-3B synthase
MPTGDGLLARLAATRALSLGAFAALCGAAQTHGNGIIEISARGSIQVRGLTPTSAPDFAAAIEALGIADPTDGRVITNPLAGLDPDETLDASGIADQLREVLIETGLAAALASKVSVVVDGGGAFALDAIPADVRLRAEAVPGGVRFHVAIAGDREGATPTGTVTPECAAKTMMGLLEAIAAKGLTARGRDLITTHAVTLRHRRPPAAVFSKQERRRRASAMADEVGRASKGDGADSTDGPTSFEGRLRRPPQDDGMKSRASIETIGIYALRDGSMALGLGLPFGHSDAPTLLNLIDEARRAGAIAMRPAPGRVLLVIGLAPARAPSLVAAAQRLGFIVRPDDVRRRVVACAGAPVCAAAEIPARALAPAIAAAAAPMLDRAATIHISGCTKGCAHSGPAALTIVGIDGRCGIVHDGSAQDAPGEHIDVVELPARVAQLAAMPREADRG